MTSENPAPLIVALLTLIASMLLAIPLANAYAEWKIVSGLDGIGEIYDIKADARRIYISAENGFYTSLDDADSWQPTGLIPRPHGPIAIGDDAVYAVDADHNLVRSDNYGLSWKSISNGIEKPAHLQKRDFRIIWIEDILPTASGELVVVAYTHGSFISYNRGEAWHNKSDDWLGPNPDDPVGRRLWNLTEFEGIYRASIPVVQPYGKAATTWARMKLGADPIN